jgi:murein DD-endopeptidase MepM/ murein hydrolase activator NlpD
VSLDVAGIVERARLAAGSAQSGEAPPGSDRARLKLIAAEFESMLLVQVLRDMRRAGSWEEEGSGDSLGAESLFETLDIELATHLARVKGMGLSNQLEEAFERLHPQTPAPAPAPAAALHATPRLETSGTAATVAHVRPDPLPPRATGTMAAMTRPVAGEITSSFGWRRDPFTKELKFHQGVDLRAAYGQEIQAAGAGRVVFSGDQGGYGATVVIEHRDGTRTRYAHLSARLVEQGDRVAAGAPLGRAGQSGRATGPHLHFEVIAPDGRRIPPELWASAQAGVGHPPGVTAARPIQDRGTDAD